MTIKNFIERAIEGGWTIQNSYYASPVKYSKLRSSNGYWTVIETDKMVTVEVNYQEEKVPMTVTHQTNTVLLDPLVWETVGKVEKWNKQCDDCGRIQANGENCSAGGTHDYGEYRYRMRHFIEALCDGLTLEEALKRATS